MSHARILPYPLRAAAPRRYLCFVRLIWRLGNVYLRFVRLSEHDTLGITALRLLESCGSRSASTLPSTPRNADSPLFSPPSAPIHLSVRDFQWAIGKGSSQTAPRTVFVLYDDNQLERDIQGRGKFHSARLSCTNIHNPCPKVQKRSVLREHQRPRRAGEVEGLYDTTRGGSTRSPAMRTRPICSAVLPRRTTAARWFKSRFARRWMPPTIVYSAALCVVGLPFVIMRPGALRWAPSFVVLARLSFLAAWLRRERSLWGNAGRNR